MIKALIALLLVCGNVYADSKFITNDRWVGRDKTYHVLGGALIGGAVTWYTDDPIVGTAVGCAFGALKEERDLHSRSHTSSLQDFAVTCLGATLGSYATQWVIHPNGVTFIKRF